MTETKYARNGKVHLAYQVVGDGPIDVVFLPGTFMPMDSYEEHPLPARFFRRLASFSRLVIWDRRGIGQSDSVSPDALPSLDEQAEDLAAVMAAAGVQQPAIVAGFDAASYAITLAGTRPDLVGPLVLVHAFGKFLQSDDHPTGFDPSLVSSYETIVEDGSSDELDLLDLVAPSVSKDKKFRDWWDRAGRRGAGPALALAMGEALFMLDIRDKLAQVSAPTTIIHKTGNPMVHIDQARYLADHIPQAKLVELEGNDNLIFVEADAILDAIEEAITGSRSVPVDRVLATVLFTDIVDSTKMATEMGDRKWHEVLDTHDEVLKRVLARGGGRLVKTTGDGLLATFDGPGPAIRCTIQLREELAAVGLKIRAGIHTGEVEVRGDDVGGIAVHIAARVMGEAGADEIIVSSVVPPLVVGSEISFDDRGPRELKGVPGEWRVLAVEG